jgi:hypothetical protein
MARSFYFSKPWQGILTRLGILESEQGTVPPPEDYNTVADIRAETSHTAGDRIFCLENLIIYKFDAASMSVDNGTTILKPGNITVGNPGRWLQEMQLAAKTHTHTEYGAKIVAPVQTKFLKSDASGNPIESAQDTSSFSVSDHTHEGYALEADLTEVAGDLATLAGSVSNKADKYAVQSGDVGKPAVFDADGNTVPGSTIIFYEYPSGALEAGVVKTCPHDKDLVIGYIIMARTADNETNAGGVPVLKPTPGSPNNSVDIQSDIDIPAPGLIIQILGA